MNSSEMKDLKTTPPKKHKHLSKRATEQGKHLKAMALIEQATKWIAAKLG